MKKSLYERIDKRTILVATILCLLSLGLFGTLGTSVTGANVDPANNTNNVTLETPGEAVFVGSYVKVPVIIDPNSSFTIDNLNFTIPEGQKGGIVSPSRDKDFNPEKPDVMLCAGYEPGIYTLQALNNSTVVGEAKFNVTDLWKDDLAGPSLCFEGIAEGFSAGSAWGGGPGTPQNINVHPALGTRRVAILLVDTNSQRFTATDAATARNYWENGVFNTTPGARSTRLYYQEVSYGKFDISGEVFGPVNLSGSWDDYINSANGAPKAGFDQSCITAGDSLINYNNFDTLVCVSLTVTGPPVKRAWAYGWGGTFATAEGAKNIGMISMPTDWNAKPLYATVAHELGHNLGLGDQYDGKYGPVIGARTTNSWELMDWEHLLPHFTLAHRMMLGWVPAGQIKTFNFASMGTPVDQTVTLNPIEQGTPPAGRYSGVEVRVADGLNYYFEYRIGQTNQIGDRQLPTDSRVLSTDVFSDPFTPPVLRPSILLLSGTSGHGNGPVLGNGQYYIETDVNDIIYPTDFNASVSGIDGNKADLHITYGINSKPDPSIRPWPAGPDRQWQSPDIEVRNARNAADPAWFNVPWLGNSNTVVASVKNNGNLDAPGVIVKFYVKDYNVGNAPETEIGTDIKDIPKGATVEFTTTWIPPREGHFCIIARIQLYFKPGPPAVVETTELNNVAQSNYDRFISRASIPSREITTVEIGNPYSVPARVFIVAGQNNPRYRTYVEHTSLILNPHETRKVKVMFEYTERKIEPERCKESPNIYSKKAAKAEEFVDYGCVPNNVGITGFVQDPRDDQPESIQVLGGVQAEVVTGHSTKIPSFVVEDDVAKGEIVTDDGLPVPGGKILLILTSGCGESQTKTYQEVNVNAMDGKFSAKVQSTWDSIEVYYVPPFGYADSSSKLISKKYCGEINGMNFNDVNGNSIKEAGETGLANWTITLKNQSGGIVTTTTDINGNYSFIISDGNYTIGEVMKAGYTQTAPGVSGIGSATYTVQIENGSKVMGKDFGNKLGEVSVCKNGVLKTADLNSGLTSTSLVNNLLGAGVAVSNVTYSGANVAAGTFSNGTGIIGFDKGIILSSGDICNVIGPNTADATSTNNGNTGDTDLNNLIPGYTTYDAAVLEFDFVPASSLVTFKYVFGSEEYNEYVNSNFNDVFGFFVNGIEVALVPGTNTPISINNLNGGNPYGINASYPAYFRNNDLSDSNGSINTELDGLTVVLTATAKVTPGERNHIKLAIADAGDHIYDSDVFIEATSFSAHKLTLEPLTATTIIGSVHTLTAKLVDSNGNGMSGQTITFNVTSGPNAGKIGTGDTNLSGTATFNYTGTTAGIDTIVATSGTETSNIVFNTWSVSAGTIVSIADSSTASGSNVSLPIMVENVTNLAAGTIWLTYDPGVVNVLDVSPGDLSSVTENINNSVGRVAITALNTTAKDGNVVFANVLLRAVGATNTTSPLTLSVIHLANESGVAIPNTVRNGVFNVSTGTGLKGDVNGDGQIDVVDALFLAQYSVGLRQLNADQLAVADTNCDGQVDIVDALFIAQYSVGLRTGFC